MQPVMSIKGEVAQVRHPARPRRGFRSAVDQGSQRWLSRIAKATLVSMAFGLLLGQSACDIAPSSGPRLKQIIKEAKSQNTAENLAARKYRFTLINVNDDVLRALDKSAHPTLRDIFPGDHTLIPRIGIGDILSITIYESGVGELFAPPSAQQTPYGTTHVTFPPIRVSDDGTIAVPFAGTLKVAGLTNAEAQSKIQEYISTKAVNPQVLVSVTKDVTNVVTLTGAVKTPGQYELTLASPKVLQLIAEAGGPTGLPSDTIVQFTRASHAVRFRLDKLAERPDQDIHAWPGDYVNLTRDPRVFLIYGAVLHPGSFSLATDETTLAQAISTAGGLNDLQADSRGVFLFRFEDPSVLRAMPRRQIVAAPAPTPGSAPRLADPVVYRLNLKEAGGLFLASHMELRDKDLIFVPVSQLVDWEKYLDLLRLTASPVIEGTTGAYAIQRAF